MRLRGLRLAAQFFTRLPVPKVGDYSPLELSRSAAWLPLIGAAVGLVVALVVLACSYRSALVAAAAGILAWVWLTGALHLDGLADLVDALAASHRDPQRFLTVLADPHLGAFGAVSVVLVLMLKFADRKSTRLNSSHGYISYAVFCLKKKSTRLNSSHGYISYAAFS